MQSSVGLHPLPSPSTSEHAQLLYSSRLLQPKIGNYLPRPRLTDALAEAANHQCVFLRSEAGYGKTWLIKDLIAVQEPTICIWYTFTREIVSLQFLQEIASELLRQSGRPGSRTATYLRERGRESQADEALTSLIEEFQTEQGQVWLVLEDIHEIKEAKLESVIESLIAARPANLRLLLTSREPLPAHQAKLQVQGLLMTVERNQIAFQRDETRRYLEGNLNLALADEQIDFLQERTSGWIAALALAGTALSVAEPDRITRFFDRLTGVRGDIYTFLAQEVYGGFLPDQQYLLKRLGLSQEVGADMVDLFTRRNDGGQILRDLAARNSFLTENENKPGEYHFHSLFSEFLLARFQDEEGAEAVRKAHAILASHFANRRDWYPTAHHAIKARDYPLAVQALEHTIPVALYLGYGQAVLSMTEEIPEEVLDESASLLEARGQAGLQVGEPRAAIDSLQKAETISRKKGAESQVIRLEYLIAAAGYQAGTLAPEQFVNIARQVATKSYQRNDIFLGAQVELSMIEVGQTLTARAPHILPELLREIKRLVARLEKPEKQFILVRAKALAAMAHLVLQVAMMSFERKVAMVHLRESTGHPIPQEERVAFAKEAFEQWDFIMASYEEALKLAKEESEIEYALIRLNFANDYAHHSAMLQVASSWPKTEQEPIAPPFDEKHLSMLQSALVTIQECINSFATYHHNYALATAYCDAADIFDMLDDLENRDHLAREALVLAEGRGLGKIAERARRLLRGENTFSSLLLHRNYLNTDKQKAAMTDAEKNQYVEYFLQAYQGAADTEAMRPALRQGVEDMVAVAKQRVEWCKHLQLVEDLRHTQSVETLYRTIPKKHISCQLLGYRSLKPGYSFDELWLGFKGAWCLFCPHRSLDP